ncbi:RNA-directed DNA polymerase, eukaryota [Tanacetum coccineum]
MILQEWIFRLPHRLNLSLRGMDIPAISCSSCNANVESANHIFFECIIASDLWKLVYRWCEIPFVQALSFEAFKDWLSSWHAPKEKKHRLFIISTSIAIVFGSTCFRMIMPGYTSALQIADVSGYTSALQIADVFGSAWFHMILPGYTYTNCRCVWLPGYMSALQIADVFGSSSGLYAPI